ncbi:MAG: DUF3817 domain-containing protein [Spirochaetia bacterium]|nr:DUF3817 domain-containing protein [Spirochaetia bacterium]
MTLSTPLGRLRIIGLVEGISFLLLLFVAMPLKYMFGMPQFVRFVGMAHGILFLIYILCLLQATLAYSWSWIRSLLLFVSTLVPFGTFVADYMILSKETK